MLHKYLFNEFRKWQVSVFRILLLFKPNHPFIITHEVQYSFTEKEMSFFSPTFVTLILLKQEPCENFVRAMNPFPRKLPCFEYMGKCACNFHLWIIPSGQRSVNRIEWIEFRVQTWMGHKIKSLFSQTSNEIRIVLPCECRQLTN